MARVTGIGGVFFKCRDPKALARWYRDHLGMQPEDFGGAVFRWRDQEHPEKSNFTIWGPFPEDTKYFDPSNRAFMVNLIVDDLDAMLARLRAAGVEVDERVEEYDYGRFGWFMDPEGTRIELWEPPREANS